MVKSRDRTEFNSLKRFDELNFFLVVCQSKCSTKPEVALAIKLFNYFEKAVPKTDFDSLYIVTEDCVQSYSKYDILML